MNDPWRDVAYAVISNKKVALKLKFESASTITLYLLNSTEHFSTKSNKLSAILSWIYSRVRQSHSIRWITPNGIKSRTLSNLLFEKPTFILFTPRSFVLGISPYFDLVINIKITIINY